MPNLIETFVLTVRLAFLANGTPVVEYEDAVLTAAEARDQATDLTNRLDSGEIEPDEEAKVHATIDQLLRTAAVVDDFSRL